MSPMKRKMFMAMRCSPTTYTNMRYCTIFLRLPGADVDLTSQYLVRRLLRASASQKHSVAPGSTIFCCLNGLCKLWRAQWVVLERGP